MGQLYANPHPDNFVFAVVQGRKLLIDGKLVRLTVEKGGNGVFRICARSPQLWQPHPALPQMNFRSSSKRGDAGKETVSLLLGSNAEIVLQDRNTGRDVLRSVPSCALGTCGSQWLFWFERYEDSRFYGMGEKSTSFEKSDSTHTFWNVDVLIAHKGPMARNHEYDPDYLSVPYVAVRQRGVWIGMLIESPFRSFISISSSNGAMAMRRHGVGRPSFSLGAEGGEPRIYILYGPTLRELTQKLQMLVGGVPRPPLWALGYHQSRWGYRSKRDLLKLAEQFRRHRFPVDGLWLDIDYMDGFRVFTFNKRHFPNPRRDLCEIQNFGVRVVPILDPGLKQDPGYAAYREAKERCLLCLTPQKREYIGMVWPGRTVFPDFSMRQCRSFWASKVKELAQLGIEGCWIDMNEPTTGTVDQCAMRFGRARYDHAVFHNLYAMLMAQATRQGFLSARPVQRPFILSRSGFTGSQRYAANWTGDNFSNYFHLRMSVPKCLNLSLSGMPFVGPDLGGFCEDTTDRLMADWIKAGFLFPFLRNHTCSGTRPQEPWNLSRKTLRLMRRFVRLRYTLMPYLYNLFINLERTGDPILRPLFYEFDEDRFTYVDDQFMVGPSIMQAPFVDQASKRYIQLPAGRWWRVDTNRWIVGRGVLTAMADNATTPFFFREGAIVPMQKGVRFNNRNDLSNIELLLCVSPDSRCLREYSYVYDDGISFNYRRGIYSEYHIRGWIRRHSCLAVEIEEIHRRFEPVRFTLVTPMLFDRLIVTVGDGVRELRPWRVRRNFFGRPIDFYVWR